MSQAKYQKFFELMISQNQRMFDDFQDIHDACQSSGDLTQEFHTKGRDVQDIVQFWERKLCQGMERGSNAQYSQIVADKFRTLVKKQYPLIDQVGITIRKAH